MFRPHTLSNRHCRLNDLYQRLLLENSKKRDSHEARELLGQLKHALAGDPRFTAWLKEEREAQSRRRTALTSLGIKAASAAYRNAKGHARNNLYRLHGKTTKNERLVFQCVGLIHIAACNYREHSRPNITTVRKNKGVLLQSSQPAKTAADCFKHLQRNLNSKPYIWAKTWAAMSPAAHEALARSHPGMPVPIYA